MAVLETIVSHEILQRGASDTYNFLEDVDLVEKHALLVLVHVALAEHLHGALSTVFSVNAHADLAEGA